MVYKHRYRTSKYIPPNPTNDPNWYNTGPPTVGLAHTPAPSYPLTFFQTLKLAVNIVPLLTNPCSGLILLFTKMAKALLVSLVLVTAIPSTAWRLGLKAALYNRLGPTLLRFPQCRTLIPLLSLLTHSLSLLLAKVLQHPPFPVMWQRGGRVKQTRFALTSRGTHSKKKASKSASTRSLLMLVLVTTITPLQ